MRAAVLTGHGDLACLQLLSVGDPEPGAGEVLVRVRASALNNTDVWTRTGAYGLPGDPDALAGWRGPIRFPRIQGGDVAGEIAALGAGVPAARLGTRVLVDPALYRDTGEKAPPVGLLGSERDGGFAEFVVAPSEQAHDVTESPLSDEQLASLPVAYGTAMGMLARADLAPGEKVLVTGSSGGVGLALVQLAAARGATVFAISSGAKGEEVRAAGAHKVVLRDRVDVAKRITALVADGLDLVADIAGGAWVERLMPLVRDDGRWVVAGAVAGPVVSFDLRRLYTHNLAMIGSSMHTRQHFGALVDLARTGAIWPRIAERYSLDELHRAQRAFLEGGHVGKIVALP